ncbi:MAG: CRISPR system precrRNA processing endoribonuclease RAMP protein Cas6 [Clostridiales bacterium]
MILLINKKYLIEEGEIFNFGLVIIGKAIEYLPYFIYCFEELGRVGFGKKFGKYNVLSIKCCNSNKVIYIESRLTENQAVIKNCDFNGETANKLIIEFKTPVKLLQKKKMISDISFEVLMKNILRRISLLSHFHCDRKLELDFTDIINKSKEIITKSSNLKFYDWERISRNTNKPVFMGGFMGVIIYEGELDDFIPFVKAGEIFHIGKGCSFGMGKFEIVVI